MASFDEFERFSPDAPPPRPATPPIRRGFLVAFAALFFLAILVYGIPYLAERTGYAWESGRARAADEALKGLDESGVIAKASYLFREAAVKAAPAVVNIRVRRPDGLGAGSGAIIDKARGFVVTNYHVVKGAEEIDVRLFRGGQLRARLVGADPRTDLAVLQIDAELKVEAEWGDSDKLDVGDWVLAIGSPYMLDQTVTAGIVSATGRNNLPTLAPDQLQDFIQTDAAVNPGNSGGPLVDLRGRVVGINTAIFAPATFDRAQGGAHALTGNVGIGMAISSRLARQVAEQLIKNGRVSRGYLGVAFADLNPRAAEQLGIKDGRGVVVGRVEPGSPADRAGLRPEDVLLTIDDRAIRDGADLRSRITQFSAGKAVRVGYLRDGKPAIAETTIAEWPILMEMGLHLQEVGPKVARRFPGHPDQVVLVDQVAPGSEAHRAGLLPGYRIAAVNGRPVATVAHCEEAARATDPAEGVPLRVQNIDGQVKEIHLGGTRPHPER